LKKKKLLEKLQYFFNANAHEKLARMDELKKILKSLKHKERKIKEEMKLCQKSDKVIKLQQELDVIYAQRMKGLKVMKEKGS